MEPSEEAVPSLSELLDELLTTVAGFLGARDLLAFQAACRRFGTLPLDTACWLPLCERAWAGKPRYRLTAARRRWLDVNAHGLSWQARYAFFARDARREHLLPEELIALRWHFNFKPAAGGQGKATVAPATFNDQQYLVVPDYPPLHFTLYPASHPCDQEAHDAIGSSSLIGASGPLTSEQHVLRRLLYIARVGAQVDLSPYTPQTLRIAHFPPHIVRRCEEDWEWVIENDNVVICSNPDASILLAGAPAGAAAPATPPHATG